MPETTIIDGNNLLYACREQAGDGKPFDFERARRELTKRLYRFAAESDGHVILIYDGTVGGRESEFHAPDFEAIFSTALSSADQLIEKHIAQSPNPEQTTVVSSDWAIQIAARAAGAQIMSCRVFIDLLKATGSETRAAIRAPTRQAPPATLGDAFP